jgi:hypothetical protein
VGVVAAAGLGGGCQWDEVQFFHLRVINDTDRVVTIQPCLDTDCLDTTGLPVTALRPGDSKDEGLWWVHAPGEKVAVAVLGPARKQIIGCLITTQGLRPGVVRASQQRPCLRSSPGAGG